MYSGELQKVQFEYSAPSIEAVLDRLPTAEVLSKKDGMFTLSVTQKLQAAVGNYRDRQENWREASGDQG